MTYIMSHDGEPQVTMEEWNFNCGELDEAISKIVSEAINNSVEAYSLSCEFGFPFVGEYWLNEPELELPKTSIEALNFGVNFSFDDNPLKFNGNLYNYFAEWIAYDKPNQEARSVMANAFIELADMLNGKAKS